MEFENLVYSRIGMTLVSAQRVEFITRELVDHLIEFDKSLYGITTDKFLNNSTTSKKLRKQTLGRIFTLLKLNPKLVLEDELNQYLEKRNLLIHGFWKNYLNTKSEGQVKAAIEFCNNFGKSSDCLERFFKGFLFFLTLRHVQDRYRVPPEMKKWTKEFDYFMQAIHQKRFI